MYVKLLSKQVLISVVPKWTGLEYYVKFVCEIAQLENQFEFLYIQSGLDWTVPLYKTGM